MKAALFQGPNKIEVKEIEKPSIQQGEALIKIHYAGICGIDFAQKMGLITANSKDETIKKVTELIREEGADIVFEAVGVQSTYDYITDIVKPDGKIIAVGAASGPLAVNFWKIFFNELNIIGIHVYDQIAFEIAIQLLNNYTEMFQHFISKVIGYNELQNEFADLAEGNASVMKILVKNE